MWLSVEWEKDSSINSSQLSGLLTQILSAHEEEQNSLASTLKEDIGQSLAAIILHLHVASSNCTDPKCQSAIAEARFLTNSTLKRVQLLARKLYPPALDSQGLGPALEVYAKDFADIASVQVGVDLELLSSQPPIAVSRALFCIAREALENVLHHAYATDVRITLREVDKCLLLSVEDDGVGCSVDAKPGWGLLRMKQRAEALGGTCIFESEPGEGAQLKAMIPIQEGRS
jgi:two-component system, NarL family, sensor histidine kinase NreB